MRRLPAPGGGGAAARQATPPPSLVERLKVSLFSPLGVRLYVILATVTARPVSGPWLGGFSRSRGRSALDTLLL